MFWLYIGFHGGKLCISWSRFVLYCSLLIIFCVVHIVFLSNLLSCLLCFLSYDNCLKFTCFFVLFSSGILKLISIRILRYRICIYPVDHICAVIDKLWNLFDNYNIHIWDLNVFFLCSVTYWSTIYCKEDVSKFYLNDINKFILERF